MDIKLLFQKALNSSFVRNFSYVSASKLATSGLSMLVKIYVVRILTKEEFGTITVLLSLYSYFSFLADMSVYQVVQKDIVNAQENYWADYNLFANTRIFTTAFSVVMFVVTAYIMDYHEYGVYITILCLSVIFEAAYKIPEILLLSFSQYSLFSKLVFGTNLFLVLAQVALISIFKNVGAYFAAQCIYLLICFWIYTYFTRKKFPDAVKFKFIGRKKIYALLKRALPLSLGSLFYLIFYRVDVFFIEKHIGLGAAGEFGLSFSMLDQFVYLIFAQFLIVIYPRLITFYKEDKAKLKRTLFYFNLSFGGFFLILLILSALLAKPVIVFVFGENYMYSAILITYMIPNLFLTCMWHFYSRVMIITASETVYLWIMAAGFVIKIALAYFMITAYGVPGIIASTFIAFTLVIVSFLTITRRAINNAAAVSLAE